MRVILLGPQRRPTVDAVIRSPSLALRPGPVGTVTAGWQERESDDGELSARLGGRDVNLGLYRRWLDAQDRDPEFAAAERRLQEVLAELQDVYLLRLDFALRAVYALQRRDGRGRLGADALAEAIEAVRELDAAHLRNVNDVRGEFFERLRPHDRPVIAGHRAAVAAGLAGAAALVIAGGHVGVLTDVLHLFNVAAALPPQAPVIAWSAGAMALAERIVLFHDRSPQGPGHRAAVAAGLAGAAALVIAGGHVGVLTDVLHLFNVAAALPSQAPVIAWSAGAMALAERIVLFHDRSPQGPGHPEVYGSGLSLVRGAVPLPHARTRLLLADTPRMAVFARRFAPARCILLDTGTRVDTEGGACPPGTRFLAEDGHVTALEAA